MSSTQDTEQLRKELEKQLEDEEVEIRDDAAKLRDAIDRIIKELDEFHFNANIAKVSGNSVSTLGGVAAIAGVVLAPFTLGSTLPLVVGGTAVSLVGGLVSGGAAVSEIIKAKGQNEDVQKQIEELQGKIRRYNLSVEIANKQLASTGNVLEETNAVGTGLRVYNLVNAASNASAVAGVVVETGKAAKYATSTSKRVAEAAKVAKASKAASELVSTASKTTSVAKSAGSAARAASSAAKASKSASVAAGKVAAEFGKGFVVFNAILLGVNIYDIVSDSIELANKEGSTYSPALRELRQQLDDIANGKF